MINQHVKTAIDKSVLCWLATAAENEPNVSPKEMFTWQDDKTLLIANIASPASIRNIRRNEKVCVSFVNIFTQKGFKLKGLASIIEKGDPDYLKKVKILTDRFSDQFPIQSVIEVLVTRVNEIKAPSYFLFPETTEEIQVANAMKTYRVQALDQPDLQS